MNQKIYKTQHKLYKKAKWSCTKNRYKLKEKQLHKLRDQIEDFVQDRFYYDDNEHLQSITNLLTIGCIEEVLDALEVV